MFLVSSFIFLHSYYTTESHLKTEIGNKNSRIPEYLNSHQRETKEHFCETQDLLSILGSNPILSHRDYKSENNLSLQLPLTQESNIEQYCES